MNPRATATTPPGMHGPALTVALLIMTAGTLYPPLLTDATGHADHGMATVALWAMSAGFVRGVGFIPQHKIWRWLFSAGACAAALSTAVLIKLLH